jgi:hypothetical protein
MQDAVILSPAGSSKIRIPILNIEFLRCTESSRQPYKELWI